MGGRLGESLWTERVFALLEPTWEAQSWAGPYFSTNDTASFRLIGVNDARTQELNIFEHPLGKEDMYAERIQSTWEGYTVLGTFGSDLDTGGGQDGVRAVGQSSGKLWQLCSPFLYSGFPTVLNASEVKEPWDQHHYQMQNRQKTWRFVAQRLLGF